MPRTSCVPSKTLAKLVLLAFCAGLLGCAPAQPATRTEARTDAAEATGPAGVTSAQPPPLASQDATLGGQPIALAGERALLVADGQPFWIGPATRLYYFDSSEPTETPYGTLRAFNLYAYPLSDGTRVFDTITVAESGPSATGDGRWVKGEPSPKVHEIRVAALHKLAAHFGGGPFKYRVTHPDSRMGEWILGTSGGEEAAVFLGQTGEGGISGALQGQAGLRPGVVLTGPELEEAMRSAKRWEARE